ncbi:DUF4932 domain-containing protein [Thermococcus argininiproducens]|uniref:DUF4932 domain-containing protein n=1 Tax=Thermococcus argininiproducens TaxID=2866384 RepID=A0A9E7M8Q3_9EURY|nr:DUF4932 domain-containing protein [Thermococcus argininiproducens]USG99173.1 DUF4932 domain-containing protein [Thermococcus argininiproducens]
MKRASFVLFFILIVSTFPQASAGAPEIVIEVNPNLELFAVVYILAFNGEDPFIIAPQDYINEVLSYFAPYKEHPAVYLMRETIPKNLPHYMRDYSINAFAASLVSKPYLGKMSENDPLLSDFYRSLVSFAKESNFMGFYKKHEEEYEEVLKPAKKALTSDIFQEFEEFFGYQYKTFHIALSYSLRIHPGSRVVGEVAYYFGYVAFMPESYSTISYLFLATHEYSHTFINPLVSKYLAEFSDLEYYLQEVRSELAYATYDKHFDTNYVYLSENLVEALTNYILLDLKPNVVYDLPKYFVLRDHAIGFYLVEDLVNEFRNFETSKGVNETFEEYIPKLIERMKLWATPENVSEYFEEKVPLSPFRLFDRGYSEGKIIIVYGIENPDSSGVEYDKETAFILKDLLENDDIWRLYNGKPEIIVKAEKELNEDDLKENLILIGGPAASGIVKSLTNLPIKFVFNGSWILKKNITGFESFVGFVIENEIYTELRKKDRDIYGYPLGVVEVVKNPWNEKNLIAVIAGVDRYSTRRLAKDFTAYPRSYGIESGNYTEVGFYLFGKTPSEREGM